MKPLVRELAEKSGFHFDVYNEATARKVELLVELVAREHINLLRKEWYDLNNAPLVENETLRDIGMRVGRKTEVNALIEKFKSHFGVE